MQCMVLSLATRDLTLENSAFLVSFLQELENEHQNRVRSAEELQQAQLDQLNNVVNPTDDDEVMIKAEPVGAYYALSPLNYVAEMRCTAVLSHIMV